jgi:hypothetical protein
MSRLPAALTAALLLSALPALAEPLVFARDAKAHIGRQATVRGTVQRVQHQSGRTFLYLEGHNRRSAFLVRIDADAAGDFPEVDTYVGRTLDVTGLVQNDQGTPEIAVLARRQVTVK